MAKSAQVFELSEADVKMAIAEFIERNLGAGAPAVVTVSVGTRCVGYGMAERDESYVVVTARRELP